MTERAPGAPLADLLADLSRRAASGCLHVRDADGQVGRVYLLDGQVYAAASPASRPSLAARLLATGEIGADALAEASEAQRGELRDWTLGELVVHLGYIEAFPVEVYAREVLFATVTDLMYMPITETLFRAGERTRRESTLRLDVDSLLAELVERGREWARVLTVIGGIDVHPIAAPAVGALDIWAAAVHERATGESTLREIADQCGLTIYEAGQALGRLVDAGYAIVEDVVAPPPPTPAPVVEPIIESPEPEYVETSLSELAGDLEPEPVVVDVDATETHVPVYELEPDPVALTVESPPVYHLEPDPLLVATEPPPLAVEPEPEPEPEPVALMPEPVLEAAPEPVVVEEPPAPFPGDSPAEIAETAELLRELSSLGAEDAELAPPPPRAPRTPSGTGGHSKKKGLFGR